nr:hypothetical protein [Tanacetum cinerariifolium]
MPVVLGSLQQLAKPLQIKGPRTKSAAPPPIVESSSLQQLAKPLEIKGPRTKSAAPPPIVESTQNAALISQ